MFLLCAFFWGRNFNIGSEPFVPFIRRYLSVYPGARVLLATDDAKFVEEIEAEFGAEVCGAGQKSR